MSDSIWVFEVGIYVWYMVILVASGLVSIHIDVATGLLVTGIGFGSVFAGGMYEKLRQEMEQKGGSAE